jgi:hypothetical protein
VQSGGQGSQRERRQSRLAILKCVLWAECLLYCTNKSGAVSGGQRAASEVRQSHGPTRKCRSAAGGALVGEGSSRVREFWCQAEGAVQHSALSRAGARPTGDITGGRCGLTPSWGNLLNEHNALGPPPGLLARCIPGYQHAAGGRESKSPIPASQESATVVRCLCWGGAMGDGARLLRLVLLEIERLGTALKDVQIANALLRR